MPRYDYQCDECGHRFELKQSFSSEPVAPCPQCLNGARRVFHAVPIVFKGSGFYVNDYGKHGSAGESAKDSKGSEGSSSQSEKKSDSADKGKAKAESKAKTKAADAKGD